MPVTVDENNNTVNVATNATSVVEVATTHPVNINATATHPSIAVSPTASAIIDVSTDPDFNISTSTQAGTQVEIQQGFGIETMDRRALAMDPETLIVGPITRSLTEAAVLAAVKWPDGTSGVYTGTESGTYPGAIDSYVITYGSSKTYTQPTVTRDGSGSVIDRPAIIVT